MTVIQFFKFRQPLDEIEEIFTVEESNDGSNIWGGRSQTHARSRPPLL